MSRTFSAEALAAETSVSVERLNWLVSIGILKPKEPGRFLPGDTFKIKLIAALLEAGFTPEQIEWGAADGSLTMDNIGRFMLVEPGPLSKRTFAEFLSEDVPRSSVLPAIYKVFGLPSPDPSSRINVFDEALLEQFLRAWRLAGSDETLIRAARLISAGTRLAAEGWIDLFQEDVAGPARQRLISGEVKSFPPEVSRTGTLLVRLIPRLVAWLTQHYLEQIATAGIVEDSRPFSPHEAWPRPPPRPRRRRSSSPTSPGTRA